MPLVVGSAGESKSLFDAVVSSSGFDGDGFLLKRSWCDLRSVIEPVFLLSVGISIELT